MTATLEVVSVDSVREGDFLSDLDNGYVVEVDLDPEVSLRVSNYAVEFARGLVMITFHDSLGEENYLFMAPDTCITVRRDA